MILNSSYQKGLLMTNNRTLILTAINILFLFFAIELNAQNIITLDQPESGNIDNVARDKVRLRPGYQYTPTAGNKMHAYIDETITGSVDPSITPFNNFTFNRDLDISLDVGTIGGSHSVSISGSANYSIPIPLPTGTNGVVPSLNLVYDSQGGNGGLGMGWSISGLSTITLIGKTIYQDGEVAPISKGNDAVFALDGNRLFSTGTNLYQTEVESFSQITSYGTSGNVPLWFKVETKNGITFEYGNTTDSRFMDESGTNTLFWRVNKMYDCHGNYIEFKYVNDDRDSRIDEILYTGNFNAVPEQFPYNKVKFYYDTRPDINTKYICGSEVTNKNLLTYIKITTEDDAFFKAFELGYAFDEVHSLLQEIIEHGAECYQYNSTIFKYGNFNPSIDYDASSILVGQDSDIFSGDFNGDGITDMVSAEFNIDSQTGAKFHTNLKVYTRTSTGFNPPADIPLPINPFPSTTETIIETEDYYKYQRQMFTSDFNGDGRDDIFFVYREPINQSGYKLHRVLVYSPVVDPLVPSGIYFNSHVFNTNNPYELIYPTINGKEGNFFVPGDFDGDGRADYITILATGISNNGNGGFDHTPFLSFPGDNDINNMVNVIDSSLPPPFDNHPGRLFAQADRINAVDYDGDGKSDLMVILGGTTRIYTFKKVGNQWTGTKLYQSSYPNMDHDIHFGDFNGDGKTDLLTRNENNGVWTKAISKGVGNSFDLTYYTSPTGINPLFNEVVDNSHQVSVGDFNGDGMSDILHSYSEPNASINPDLFNDVYYSKGNDFYWDRTIIPFSNEAFLTGLQTFGDYNGDGRLDIIVKRGTGSSNGNISILQFNDFDKAGILQKVTNGLNTTVEFVYRYLTQGVNYSKVNPSTYPLVTIQPSLPTVSSVSLPDGNGGSNMTSYSYEEAKMHLQGKGFLGFRWVESENIYTSGIKTRSEFEFDDTFYAIALKKEKTFLIKINEADRLMAETIHNNTFVGIDNDKRYWIEPTSIETIDYISQGVTTVNNIYDNGLGLSNGNLTQQVTSIKNIGSSTNIETKTVDFSQYTSECSWIPSRVGLITTTLTRKNEAPYTTSTRKYYNNNGVVDQSIDYYNLPNAVTTTYSNFDVFGNAQDISVGANGLTTRNSSVTYDSKGRFATIKTNALNQSEIAILDPRWGKPIESTSIDGLTTKFKYDGFGRLRETITPLGNVITKSWHWDIQTGIGTSTTTADDAVYYTQTQHSGAPDIKIWYNQFARKRKTQTEAYNNQLLNTVVSYDMRGNPRTETAPFYEGTSPAVITTSVYEDDLINDPPLYYNAPMQAYSSAGITTYDYSHPVNGESKVTMTNPAGQVTSSVTDVTGKTIRTTDHGGTININYFSHGGQKNRMVGNEELISMTYDIYGRQTSLIDVSMGETEYLYNAFGDLEYQEDAKGHETFYYYDELGRLDYQTLPEGTIDYQYVESGNGLGMTKKIINFTGSIKEYIYDEYSRVSQTRETIDGTLHLASFTYDNYSRTTSITYPSGFSIHKEYDSNGFLEKTTNGSGITIFQTGTINAYGQYTQYTLGNGIVSNMGYDDHGFPESYSAGNIQNLSMDFDWQTGNMEYRHDLIKNKYESFTYDNLNRLKTADILNGTSIATNFDDNGNIDFKTDVGTYAYHPTKIHAVQEVTNPTGTISSMFQDMVSYTSFQQPNQIIEGNYQLLLSYGSDLNREKTILKQNGTTINTRYFFGSYEKNISNGTTQHIHYITCGDGLNAVVVRENGIDNYYYTYQDHLGSIVTVTDDSGSVVTEQNFDPWGRQRNPSTWTYSNIPSIPNWLYRGYTGHEHLQEFDLINMNGRLYDPIVGRMLSPDNYIHGGTQGLNRYSYAFNNPLKYTDPDGEHPVFVAVGISVASGLITNGVKNVSNGRHFFDNVGSTVFFSALGGLVSFGVGSAAKEIFGVGFSIGKAAFQLGAHGLSQGGLSAIQGGNFWQGAAAGAFSSALGSGLDAAKLGNILPFQAIAGGVGGGFGSWVAGGKFTDGIAQGMVVTVLNHALHVIVQENYPTPEELNQRFGDSFVEQYLSYLIEYFSDLEATVSNADMIADDTMLYDFSLIKDSEGIYRLHAVSVTVAAFDSNGTQIGSTKRNHVESHLQIEWGARGMVINPGIEYPGGNRSKGGSFGLNTDAIRLPSSSGGEFRIITVLEILPEL